jgi:hypothetical protein
LASARDPLNDSVFPNGSYKYFASIACRYPERFAQEALGHNSKAVHRAYAKRALMKIPSLEDYEQKATAESV